MTREEVQKKLPSIVIVMNDEVIYNGKGDREVTNILSSTLHKRFVVELENFNAFGENRLARIRS
jgi:hypothetical protein